MSSRVRRTGTDYNSKVAVVAVVVCLTLFESAFAFPRPDYPPLAHTGGFREPTCQECHQDEALNPPGGSLRIDSLPARWRPGETYRVVVTVSRAQLERAGFELAARFADGTQAGALAPADTTRSRVSIDTTTHIQFAHHTLEGTRAAVTSNAGRWTVLWTAPRRRGTVVFNAAAVASNDDESNFGDFVYAVERRIPR